VSEHKVIEAIKAGDATALKGLLAAGANVNEQDEHGWTPLNWAAGRGDVEAIELLLARGADVALVGRDRRTPLAIAKAASQGAAAALLAEAEKRLGLWVDPRGARLYCRAYYLRDMRRFPQWSEGCVNWQETSTAAGGNVGEVPPTGDEVVYLHLDLTVTKSLWHDESVIFSQRTPEWEEFCDQDLGFAVPDDLL
jgi:hypothetical protein